MTNANHWTPVFIAATGTGTEIFQVVSGRFNASLNALIWRVDYVTFNTLPLSIQIRAVVGNSEFLWNSMFG